MDQASRRGIYVLLDMHQDIYSRHLGGDGAPHWAIPPEVNIKDYPGKDLFQGASWGLAYRLSSAVTASFAHLGDLLDGQFENDHLKPFYQETISGIRDVHPRAVGFVEPHIMDMYACTFTPFDLDGLVYAPHLYNQLSVACRFQMPFEDLIWYEYRKESRELLYFPDSDGDHTVYISAERGSEPKLHA